MIEEKCVSVRPYVPYHQFLLISVGLSCDTLIRLTYTINFFLSIFVIYHLTYKKKVNFLNWNSFFNYKKKVHNIDNKLKKSKE